MKASQLLPTEYLPFYGTYIDKAVTLDLIPGLENSFKNTLNFFKSIPENKLEFSYADGKWTVKEIIQHLIDAERVFAYRALRFARQDKTPLPGFDENEYAVASDANNRTIEDLIEEYISLRQATIAMFKSFSDDVLMQIGIASQGETSVRAVGFIIIGHETHHCAIIRERYL